MVRSNGTVEVGELTVPELLQDLERRKEGLTEEVGRLQGELSNVSRDLEMITAFISQIERSQRVRKSRDRPRGMGIRVTVLAELKDWATVSEVAETTGLERRQVEAVLYAKDLREQIQRRGNGSGKNEYRYVKQAVSTESD